MRLLRPLFLARLICRDGLFRMRSQAKSVCLSFDDGPDPLTTPRVLDILAKSNVKALFFCKGSCAEEHPELVERIVKEGHIVGNHGYNHLNGWKTPFRQYVNDIERSAEYTSTTLLRPPYGKIGLCQLAYLKRRYTVFFWDLMPYDFDMSLTPREVLVNVDRGVRNGSIIVLHDRRNSWAVSILEELIQSIIARGYSFVLPGGLTKEERCC